MPPRQIPTGQVRLTFGVAPGSAAADAAGATVDENDQHDEAVLVAELQKVYSVAKRMTRAWTSVMMICRPTHTLSLSFSLSPSYSLTHSCHSFPNFLCVFFPDIC